MDDSVNPSNRLKEAVRLHQQGELEAAQLIYAGVLDVDPQNPDALHLMGLIAYQREDYTTAVDLIARAIQLNPLYPVYHKNLGNAYKAMGRLEQAAGYFLAALEQQPAYVEAYIDLGNIRQIQRQYQQAIDIYQKALELSPDNPDIYNNLGAAYHELGSWPKAIDCFQAALQRRPDQREVHNNLGNALQAAGRYDDAIECYRHAVRHGGGHPKIWLNLGNACRKIGKLPEAMEHYQRALDIDPNSAEALNNLANLFKEQGDYEKALPLYQKSTRLDPDNPDFHFNTGLLHHLQNHIDPALASYRKAVEIEPGYAEAWLNIGKIRHETHAFDQALNSYRKAIEINPDYAEARFNRSLTLLTIGELADGFREYEWRFECPKWQSVYPHLLQAPRWDGSAFRGQRLLVFSEQGIGDTLQFIRYLPAVKALGGEVIFETLPELLTLLKDFKGVDGLAGLSMQKKAAETYDLQIPLMSLAALFCTDLASVPADVPYIQADPAKVRCWSRKIGGAGLKVGLVWAGKPEHENDHRRSCPLNQLKPLLQIRGVEFIGLQKGRAAGQMERLPRDLQFVNFGSSLNDFADTAAVIDCLDLVIAVDTAVAHLAGVMGKPVWLLLPYTPDWRWLMDRSDSPWYPTMRLFRQPGPDDWPAAVRTVCDALVEYRQQQKPAPPADPDTVPGRLRQVNDRAINPIKPPATATAQAAHGRGRSTLYLGLQSGSNYGWGVCSDYLIRELSKLTPVHVINEQDGSADRIDLPGKLFQALTNINLVPMFENARGRQNYGYTFFENELTANSLANAKKFDLIIGGSTWCRDRLREKGIKNCDVLIQGIDSRLFYPVQHQKPSDRFVVFSGGKFELRKGQDLVLRALQILQDKYDDIVLVNCWYNLWPQSIQMMAHSPYIRLPGEEFDTWPAYMNAVYQANGLDPARIKTFELVPNQQLRELYRQSDLGIFPNRCEGGTNLVLMEYMACAKPVIASYASGHTDIVTEENALLLNDFKNMHLVDGNQTLIARWQEPSLDELVATIEYAYQHRDEIRRIGHRAGQDMQRFTWEKSARNLLRIIGD
jgi:tetratricopeptide (TPR) repeat protein/glycosyltransferase involved in cell wall biosynthesis